MAVVFFVEPVVPVGRVAIDRFLQAAQQLGAKGIALGMLGQNLQELGDLFALRKVAHDDFERAEQFAEFAEPLGVGIVVNAVERGEFLKAREAGHGLVGGEHELFDELVTLVVLDFFEAIGVAVFVDEDFGLGHVEIEAAVGHAVAAELARDFPEGTNPRLQVGELGVGQLMQGAAGGAGLVFGWERQRTDFRKVVGKEEGVGLFVGEPFAGTNDGVRVGGGGDFTGLRKREEDRFAEAVLSLDEGAKTVGKLFGQHRNDRADEVGGIAASLSLAVERGPGADVAGHVGDVDADLGLAGGRELVRERVVEVFGVVGVDGENRQLAVVEAAGRVFGRDAVGQEGCLALDIGRKTGGEVELLVNAEELRPRLVGLAEAGRGDAGERFAAVGPVIEFDHDLVAGGHFDG